MSSNQQRMWYFLVQADGTPFSNSTADKVYVKSTDDIADLRKAVKAENAAILPNVDSSDLKVFRSKADLTGLPLGEETPVSDLGEAGKKKKSALLILVPDSRVSSRSSSETSVAPATKKRKDTFYVVDGRYTYPLPSSCTTLFISSPRSDHFKDFVKPQKATVWYFPVWTLEELSTCRQKCYPSFPPDVLAERFHVYGGVARFAFYDFKAGAPYVRKDPLEMQTVLADASAVKSLRAIGLPSEMFEMTHTLLLMLVGERQGFQYQFLYADIASKYVGEQLWDHHYAEMITNLKEMFGGSPDEISRHLYEIYGHRILSKGGKKLKCRSLEDDTESELQLDKLNGERIPMGKNNIPKPPLDSYYEPSDDDQFPAVDSISKQGMFQFTVGAEHSIRGVQVLKQLCKLQADPQLYFVVPPHRFARFKKQKFLEKQVSSQVGEIPGLKQFVLELEV
ncbi:hypothetical protein MIR68_011673 [Amoeboaphelidium protococcarum]|nr:hypothetical protein MIR68_011673 [Amoeboaphelidium protococcarum]